MKIVENSKCNEMEFGKLKCGDVFFFSGDYCTKVHEVNDETDGRWNAVRLVDGEHELVSSETKVQPVDCELHIK